MNTPPRDDPGIAKPPQASRRTTPLPTDWHHLRRAVLQRDGYQCTWHDPDGIRCTTPATDVDHVGDPADHGMHNLRSLCGPHHDTRTGKQAAHARWGRVRQAAARAKPRHPGLR